jgi:hypothetical protein
MANGLWAPGMSLGYFGFYWAGSAVWAYFHADHAVVDALGISIEGAELYRDRPGGGDNRP